MRVCGLPACQPALVEEEEAERWAGGGGELALSQPPPCLPACWLLQVAFDKVEVACCCCTQVVSDQRLYALDAVHSTVSQRTWAVTRKLREAIYGYVMQGALVQQLPNGAWVGQWGSHEAAAAATLDLCRSRDGRDNVR